MEILFNSSSPVSYKQLVNHKIDYLIRAACGNMPETTKVKISTVFSSQRDRKRYNF